MTLPFPAAALENLSPCIGVCAMEASGFCRGCARTLEEIGAWMALSFADRREVLEKLSARKASSAGDKTQTARLGPK